MFSFFQNLILNLREEDIRNVTFLEKLTKTEEKTEDADCTKAVESVQECVVGNEKVRSLNTVNCDLGSDSVNNTVDTCDIILRIKPELLIQLKSVATGAA